VNILVTVLNPIGGIRTYLKYTYKNYDYSNEKIFILLKDGNGELTKNLQEYFYGLPVTIIRTESLVEFYFKATKIIAENKVDLIHSHGFKSSLISQTFSFLKKKPHLLTCHELITKRHFENRFGFIFKAVLKLLLKKVDRINTVSKDATANLKEFGIKRNDMVLIENGIDVEYFKTGVFVDIRAKLKIDTNKKILGFFGRFMPEKGFNILVDAFHLLHQDPSVDGRQLPVIITYGWGGFIREEYERIEALGLSEYFIQQPATNQMPSIIKSLEGVVIPSITEACGLIALESLCVETPVIGTNCNGLREVLEETPAFVAQFNSAESLKEAIMSFLVDDRLIEFNQYGVTARNRFDVKNASIKLKETYKAMHLND
jgi:glycosyltransferase involved in cell wall biosynthesis